MGIDGHFKQLSPYVLEKLKEEPGLVRVFTDARWISEIDVLRGRGLFLYQKEFEEIKADIPLVIAEGKNEYLDIDKYWHGIHFLLTKDSSWESCKLPFLVINYSEWDNLPLVNAVMGGTGIEEHDRDFAPVRYLTHNEVKQIVEALPKITEEGFRERFNQAVMLNPDVYKSTLWWEEGIFEDFQDIKNEITEYYQDAATKGNAMLIWLG